MMIAQELLEAVRGYRPTMPNPIGSPPHNRITPIRQVDPEDLWFYIYRDVNGQFRWRLIAGDSKRIAASGESYRNLVDCEDAINLVAATDGRPMVYAPGIRL